MHGAMKKQFRLTSGRARGTWDAAAQVVSLTALKMRRCRAYQDRLSAKRLQAHASISGHPKPITIHPRPSLANFDTMPHASSFSLR